MFPFVTTWLKIKYACAPRQLLPTRPLAPQCCDSMSTSVVEGSVNGEGRPVTPLREVRTIPAACIHVRVNAPSYTAPRAGLQQSEWHRRNRSKARQSSFNSRAIPIIRTLNVQLNFHCRKQATVHVFKLCKGRQLHVILRTKVARPTTLYSPDLPLPHFKD